MLRAAFAFCSIAAVMLSGVGCRSTDGPLTMSSDAGASNGADAAVANACTSCLVDSDCSSGDVCAQYGGDSFCATPCAQDQCLDTATCTTVSNTSGNQVQICISTSNPCGQPSMPDPDAGMMMMSNGMCGPLAPPDMAAHCSCSSSSGCTANGCYGGWWCNTQTNRCQRPPSPVSCGGDGGVVSTFDAGAHPTPIPLPIGTVNAADGKGAVLADLQFAIVGDTRPASPDDTLGYPTAVIDRIWADVQSDAPSFAVTTGDYMFASPGRGEVAPQLDLYLQARAEFAGWVFSALGNHECTGRTNSNCGAGNPDGMTENYQAFLTRMLQPVGATLPYYSVYFHAADGSWTAKFVFVAANAWSQDQATWLDQELAKGTTYTFVVRHEGASATEAPGVTPSGQIMAQHSYTVLLAGHTHTFEYRSSLREVIIGNGGAPLSGSFNYGYVIGSRRASDGAMHFAAKDYVTKAPFYEFTVMADGSPTQ